MGLEQNTPVQHADPCQNQLLSALPHKDAELLFPDLKRVHLPEGTSIREPGQVMHQVYFPTTCIVSLVCELTDGCSVETAMVGREGCVGAAGSMGAEATNARAIVQSAGDADRMSLQSFKSALQRSDALMQLLLYFGQALLTQIGQTVVCNRHHTVEQRLARRLLWSSDCLGVPQWHATHEWMAAMLGVRREGVTTAAGKLKCAGLIDYRRGEVRILDHSGLEARACECYREVSNEYQRLLGASGRAYGRKRTSRE
ncbi:MAG: Crp/Fnr family transcriptional regulator [Halieaceae bacterium]|jgi:CRP-like cAMP-binding protein|nr:Crp/Fnr family transcriptional regulator [Halieaceae bacterium]